MAWITQALGEWLPDRPPSGLSGMSYSAEVIPLTADSYTHWRALSPYSAAITARCLGASTVTDKNQVVNVFAGDATKLYLLNTAGGTWTDVAKAGDYTNTAERWTFAQYGERVIATNFVDAVQSYVMGSSTDFADLGGTPPKARYVAVIRNFTFLGYVNDASDGVVPQRVHWSAFGDPTSWPAVGSTAAAEAQSDRRDLFGDFGAVQGIVSNLGNADGAIIMQRGVLRVTYVGPPFVFEFDLVNGVAGCSAPGSIVTYKGVCYYLSDGGWVAFDGVQSVPIGQGKVDNYFLSDLNRARQAEIFAAVDPVNKVMCWNYPSTAAPTSYCDKLLLYHIELGRWAQSFQNTEIVFRTMSLGYTLDGLDTLFSDLDAMEISLDSDVWVGGRLQMGAFDTSHKLAYFEGDPKLPSIKGGELEDIGGGRRGFVSQMRLLGDLPSTAYTMGIDYRDDLNTSPSSTGSTAPGADNTCPQRIAARYARPTLTVSTAVTFRHLRGMQMNVQREGRR